MHETTRRMRSGSHATAEQPDRTARNAQSFGTDGKTRCRSTARNEDEEEEEDSSPPEREEGLYRRPKSATWMNRTMDEKTLNLLPRGW